MIISYVDRRNEEMGLDRSKKHGGFFSEEPKPPKRKTHYRGENRGYGDIRGLCKRPVRIDQIVDIPDDVECEDCREKLRKAGLL